MVPAAEGWLITLTLTWCDIAPCWPSVHGPCGVTPSSLTPASLLRVHNTFSSKSPLKVRDRKGAGGERGHV